MNKFKKFVRFAIASITLTCVLAVSASALSGTGTVKVNTSLNVRSSASASSTVIGKLYNGTQVTIIDSSNGWYKISYNGTTGWVSASYITLSSSTVKIQTVVNTAASTLGVKYTFGGTSPTTGFDCSGLTMYCFAKVGVTLPHSSSMQATMGTAVSRANLKEGDIIFFDTSGTGTVNHCGIYIGNNNFINAQSGAGLVKEASLTTSYWSNAYLTARRYIF